MAITDRLTETLGIVATMGRARLIAPMRPDKYVRIAAAMQRENMGITSGFAAAAQRCPDRPGLVDELGTLTWREIDQRADAFAAALQDLRRAGLMSAGAAPKVIGIMARNHRGFVEALIAANRIGADVLLLNTSFAGPALAEVVAARRRRRRSSTTRSSPPPSTARWPTHPTRPGSSPGPTVRRHGPTVEKLIAEHTGREPQRANAKSQGHPAHVGHHRNTQGRQALRR